MTKTQKIKKNKKLTSTPLHWKWDFLHYWKQTPEYHFFKKYFNASASEHIGEMLFLTLFLQNNPKHALHYERILDSTNKPYFSSQSELEKYIHLIHTYIPNLHMKNTIQYHTGSGDGTCIVSPETSNALSYMMDIMTKYLFILSSVEKEFPSMKLLFEMVNESVPQLNVFLEQTAPILSSPLLLIGIGEGLDIILFITKTFITFMTMIMNLSRKDFTTAFMFFIGLFPIFGTIILNTQRSFERFSLKYNQIMSELK